MLVKTKNLLLGIFVCMLSISSAVAQQQTSHSEWSGHEKTVHYGQNYATTDVQFISEKRMKQHNDFIQHRYIFPAKPRNMWELGVGAGLYNLFADVPGLMLWDKGGYGFHAHVRKAWGYVISSRLQYDYGIAKGLQWQESRNYRYNTAWNQNYYAAGNPGEHKTDVIHYNYRMESHQLNGDVIVAANNIRFHKARTFMSLYGFVGVGVNAYKTYVNTLNGSELYNYCEIDGGVPQIAENQRKIILSLQKGYDDTYETAAESEAGRAKASFGKKGLGGVGKTLIFVPSVGGGMAFRLTKHLNLAIEDRVSIPLKEDLLDGQRWAEQVYGSPVLTQRNDVINYFSASFNFNIGGRKKIEPLYWINPMVYTYSQLDNGSHMIIPEIYISDKDWDGIADQFDLCPNTPKGVAVDSRGCPLDTDGDTVPDYMDKQLITPTECQPSDADGIGKCPCPECPPTIPGYPNNPPPVTGCEAIGMGDLVFNENDASLTRTCKAQLDDLARNLTNAPECMVLIKTFPKPLPRGRRSQEIARERMTNVVEYLENKGISKSRMRWKYDEYMSATSQVVQYMVPISPTEGWSVYGMPRMKDEN
jgi:hypothetical protein